LGEGGHPRLIDGPADDGPGQSLDLSDLEPTQGRPVDPPTGVTDGHRQMVDPSTPVETHGD